MAEKKIEDADVCVHKCISRWVDCMQHQNDTPICRVREKNCFQECRGK